MVMVHHPPATVVPEPLSEEAEDDLFKLKEDADAARKDAPKETLSHQTSDAWSGAFRKKGRGRTTVFQDWAQDVLELEHKPTKQGLMDIFSSKKIPRGSRIGEATRKLGKSRYLNFAVLAAVLLNSIQMGAETDYHGDVDLTVLFEVLDNLFVSIFVIELCIKLWTYGRTYFYDGWNLFDFTLTFFSVLDMWVLTLLSYDSGLKTLTVLRAFRVFRAVRLLRLIPQFRQLTMIVEALLKSMKTTIWVVTLLIMILYIFSILAVNIIGRDEGIYEAWDDDVSTFETVDSFNAFQYFGTIPRSMYTLLMIAMMTDDWFISSRAIMEKQPLVFLCMLVFIFFTSLGLLIVILGIILENVKEVTRILKKDELKEEGLLKTQHIHELCDFIGTLDASHDGLVDVCEVKNAWIRPEMKELLSMVPLPVGMNPDEFVALIDSNGDASFSTDELIKGMVRLVTSEPKQERIEFTLATNETKRALRLVENEVDKLVKHMNASARDHVEVERNLKCLRSEVSQLVSAMHNRGAVTPCLDSCDQNLPSSENDAWSSVAPAPDACDQNQSSSEKFIRDTAMQIVGTAIGDTARQIVGTAIGDTLSGVMPFQDTCDRNLPSSEGNACSSATGAVVPDFDRNRSSSGNDVRPGETTSTIAKLKADVHEAKMMLQNLQTRPSCQGNDELRLSRPGNVLQSEELRDEMREIRAMLEGLGGFHEDNEYLKEVRETKAMLHYIFYGMDESCRTDCTELE